MIDLYNAETNGFVGNISEAELQQLKDCLEEESTTDDDYYIQQGTIDLLAEDGQATDHLLQLLRTALGTADGVELRWRRP